MRFIHTADWHLGRLFHGVHLTEDQAYVLDQFVGLVKEAKPDVVLVAGGSGCESERPLSVGGAGTVEASRYREFHYVALGHLHGPQSLGCDGAGKTIHYCGSLLKYSFDEADQRKLVYVVEMDGDGV